MNFLLDAYSSYRKTGVLNLFEESITNFLNGSISSECLSERYTERFNSFLSFALCSPSGSDLRLHALKLIHMLADDDSCRCALVTQFAILRPLLYGILQWQDHLLSIEALRAFCKCTLDIHYVRPSNNEEILVSSVKKSLTILKKFDNSEEIEIALGILANLSRIPSVIHKALHKREDFAALRRVLLQIMSSETASQINLVLSMTVRFQLWGVEDKFFEGQNFNRTVNVIFNILLNGELNTESLYAGTILVDFCKNPKTFKDLKSYPDIRRALSEITLQLSSKNAKLVRKLLGFLSCVVRADVELCDFVRSMIFSADRDVGSGCLSAVSEHLLQPRDDLLAASVASFIYDMESSLSKEPDFTALGTPSVYVNSLLQIFSIIVQSLSSAVQCLNERQLEGFFRHRKLMRCASFIVQRISQLCSSLDAESVEIAAGHVARLAFLVQSLVQRVFTNNPRISSLLGSSTTRETSDHPANHDSIVAEMVYAVDALDLLLTCIDFLAMASPLSASQKSQENMDPMEDPDETRIDCTPQMAEMRLADGQTDGDRVSSPSSSSLADSLKRCGDALQRYLESPLAASMLAFTITTDGCRSAVLRLLRVALSLPNFSTKSFVKMMANLLPPHWNSLDHFVANRLRSHRGVEGDSIVGGDAAADDVLGAVDFHAEWIAATQPRASRTCRTSSGDFQPQTRSNHHHQSEEQTLSKLSAALDNTNLTFATVSGSEAMAICRRKIEVLQSREANLEADLTAKAEALRTSDAVAEHFRNRAITAECDVTRLLGLQLDALAASEDAQARLTNQRNEISRFEEECKSLSAELTAKRKELEVMQAARQTLQNKLNSTREQVKTMDATIDDYRKQLDEAKQVIHQKDTQIEQYSNMTRLINQLTGNGATAPVEMPAGKKS